MGGGGSSSGGGARRTTYGLDDEHRVTIVKGVRLSEAVIQRMKEGGEPPAAPSPGGGEAQAQTQARAQAQAKAREQTRAQAEEAWSRRLELERSSPCELAGAGDSALAQAVLREQRLQVEEERRQLRMANRHVEEKEKELAGLQARYRQQISEINKKSTTFYKSSWENFTTAATETESKLPQGPYACVCGDFERNLLSCYNKNCGQTLNCSAMAKQYLQCVNGAKMQLLGKAS